MGWILEGDHVVVQDTFGCRVLNQLYQKSLNLLPLVFLNDAAGYGVHLDDSRIKISKDRYFAVHGTLREKIKHDLAYKIELHRITWSLLYEFARITANFEAAVVGRRLDSQHLDAALDACAKVLTLTEFNGVLPLEWYQERLAAMFGQENAVRVEDFSYSEALPHRLLLRWAKLRLVREYQANGSIRDLSIHRFIVGYGYLDPLTDHVLLHPSEDPARVVREVQMIAEMMAPDDVAAELRQMHTTRRQAHEHYHAQHQRVALALLRSDTPSHEAQNFISALTIISLAVTEEEYRHIWQDRFLRALGAVLRGLELPATTSWRDLVATLRVRPRFTPDLPGPLGWAARSASG